jgi:hypothetical protein
MKNSLKIALGLALLPTLAFAADFSGSWVRDAAKSDAVGYPVYWVTRVVPAVGGGGGGNNEVVAEVKQTPQALQVVYPNRPLRNYPLDGQSRTVTTDTGIQKANVTAKAVGETLVVSTVQSYGGMPGNVPTTTNETWMLSPDGKVLTISTVRNSPATTQTFKEVYNKR